MKPQLVSHVPRAVCVLLSVLPEQVSILQLGDLSIENLRPSIVEDSAFLIYEVFILDVFIE